MNLNKIFPAEDFRLKMRFERSHPSVFYRRGRESEEVLNERCQWLDREPDVCTAMTKAGSSLMEELLALAIDWDTIPQGVDTEITHGLSPLEQCRWLCRNWECDFLLLSPDSEGTFRLRGGALCFPSHWDLHQKLNRTVADIHGPVPGLNEALGHSIDGFLSKIKPGISWERHNWGLSGSAERNQHPSRPGKSLDQHVEIEDVWWRLEDQSLVSLPESNGVLFGIRVSVHPLSTVRDHPSAGAGLRQALQTMSAEMADYKGLTCSRERLSDLL